MSPDERDRRLHVSHGEELSDPDRGDFEMPITAEQSAVLDQRLAAHRADKVRGRLMTEVLAVLRRRLAHSQ